MARVMAARETSVPAQTADAVGIDVSGVSKAFGAVQALADVDVRVRAGEFLSLIGPSGCGKTTLLKIVAGLVPADRGRVTVGDRTVNGPGRECSVVFQDFALLPWGTVQTNVEFGLLLRGVTASERAERARRAIAKVGLAGFERAYPAQLSGGMQQRVGLARALAVNPRVLLMDEPFASIDEQTRRVFQDELLSLWSEERKTVVLVTHSMEEAIYLSDRVVVLSPRPGRVHRVLDVPLPRPREGGDVRATAEFARLVDGLWKILRKLQ
jgi:ABC-type nitrate/sulfonate/bicarbonate transport system ATPase subunit